MKRGQQPFLKNLYIHPSNLLDLDEKRTATDSMDSRKRNFVTLDLDEKRTATMHYNYRYHRNSVLDLDNNAITIGYMRLDLDEKRTATIFSH